MKAQMITALLGLCLSSAALADTHYSKIDEKLLLDTENDGSDSVVIYSNVRNKTIELAMNTNFNRIENMMFINTVIEMETGELSYADDEC